jgi:hypothetical protein
MSPSYSGFLFRVEHFISIFVKHDAWNEFGRGHMLRFLITLSALEWLPELQVPKQVLEPDFKEQNLVITESFAEGIPQDDLGEDQPKPKKV